MAVKAKYREDDKSSVGRIVVLDTDTIKLWFTESTAKEKGDGFLQIHYSPCSLAFLIKIAEEGEGGRCVMKMQDVVGLGFLLKQCGVTLEDCKDALEQYGEEPSGILRYTENGCGRRDRMDSCPGHLGLSWFACHGPKPE